MIALYIIAGIIIFFTAVLSFNASLRVIFNSNIQNISNNSDNSDNSDKSDEPRNMNIYAKIGFYKIYIIPGKPEKIQKPKRPGKKKEKPGKIQKKKKVKEEKKEKDKKKIRISEIITFAKDIAFMFWKKLRKYLKIKIYKINANIASDDSCKTAMLYGAVTQSAYYLYEFLDSNFKIRRKTNDNIKIIPDFAKESVSFDIDVKIYIRLSHILNILLSAAISFLKFRVKSNAASDMKKHI